MLHDVLNISDVLTDGATAIVDDSFSKCFTSHTTDSWNWTWCVVCISGSSSLPLPPACLLCTVVFKEGVFIERAGARAGQLGGGAAAARAAPPWFGSVIQPLYFPLHLAPFERHALARPSAFTLCCCEGPLSKQKPKPDAAGSVDSACIQLRPSPTNEKTVN